MYKVRVDEHIILETDSFNEICKETEIPFDSLFHAFISNSAKRFIYELGDGIKLVVEDKDRI